jgi:uncharacterized membrane protein YecN with MAPEG domain
LYLRRARASRCRLWQDDYMRNVLPRLLAGLPDAVTAALFLTAWIDPSIPGPEYVKNLMLVMLIEFIVMHSSAFHSVIAADDGDSPIKRSLMLIGLSAFYLAFVAGFALAFDSTWPLFAFGWLFVSRFIHLWIHPAQSGAEGGRMMALWGASALAYLVGALATVMLPLPALGITPEFIASMHLPGSGEWIERPYTVLAFGALYFAVQAWVKYALSGADTSQAAARKQAL